jgi:hypothetical protein
VLADRSSKPGRVCNRIPEPVRGRIVDLAFDKPKLSPREFAVTFADAEQSVRKLHPLLAQQ